jgi:hypothetical protein
MDSCDVLNKEGVHSFRPGIISKQSPVGVNNSCHSGGSYASNEDPSMRSFLSTRFEFGKIPENPPPKNVC